MAFPDGRCCPTNPGGRFPESHDLLMNSKRRCLQHQLNQTYLLADQCRAKMPTISHLQQRTSFSAVLQEFLHLLLDIPESPEKDYGVDHVIVTAGALCFAKPRHLPPDQLQAAKQEFALMVKEQYKMLSNDSRPIGQECSEGIHNVS